MWFFLVLTLSVAGEIIKERYEYPDRAACIKVQKIMEHQLSELGNFVITECGKEK